MINPGRSHSSAGSEPSLNPFMPQKAGIEGSCVKVGDSVRAKAIFNSTPSPHPCRDIATLEELKELDLYMKLFSGPKLQNLLSCLRSLFISHVRMLLISSILYEPRYVSILITYISIDWPHVIFDRFWKLLSEQSLVERPPAPPQAAEEAQGQCPQKGLWRGFWG